MLNHLIILEALKNKTSVTIHIAQKAGHYIGVALKDFSLNFTVGCIDEVTIAIAENATICIPRGGGDFDLSQKAKQGLVLTSIGFIKTYGPKLIRNASISITYFR